MEFITLYSKEIYEQLKLEQYNKTEITNKLIDEIKKTRKLEKEITSLKEANNLFLKAWTT